MVNCSCVVVGFLIDLFRFSYFMNIFYFNFFCLGRFLVLSGDLGF